MKKYIQVLFLAVAFHTATAQSVLKGIVQDEKKIPVEAATVNIKGTNIFKVTDAKGQFTINLPQTPPVTLVVTSAGFSPAEAEMQKY